MGPAGWLDLTEKVQLGCVESVEGQHLGLHLGWETAATLQKYIEGSVYTCCTHKGSTSNKVKFHKSCFFFVCLINSIDVGGIRSPRKTFQSKCDIILIKTFRKENLQ